MAAVGAGNIWPAICGVPPQTCNIIMGRSTNVLSDYGEIIVYLYLWARFVYDLDIESVAIVIS